MFEKIAGLNVKGRMFGETGPNLIWGKAPAANPQLVIVFGRNGSGKSTCAQAIRSLAADKMGVAVSQDFDGSSFVDQNRQSLEAPSADKMWPNLFVFDEEYIATKIQLKDDHGLGTIVLLGEQVEIDRKLSEVNNKLVTECEKLKALNEEKTALEGTDKPGSMPSIRHAIETQLKSNGHWADRYRDIYGNVTKAAVKADKVENLCKCQLLETETLADLKKLYDNQKMLLDAIVDIAAVPQRPVPTMKDLRLNDDAIVSLLSAPLHEPILTEREKAIRALMDQPQYGQGFLNTAVTTFTDDSVTVCPFCQRDIANDEKQNLVTAIRHILSHEVEEFVAKVRAAQISLESLDVSSFTRVDSELCSAINTQYLKFQEIGNNYNELLEKRIKNPFTPIHQSPQGLVEAWQNLNALLAKLESKRHEIVVAADKKGPLQERLESLNDKLAYRENETMVKLFQNTKTKHDEVQQEEVAQESVVKRLTDEKETLEAKKKDTQIAIGIINRYLAYAFFGRDRLSISNVGGVTYQLNVNSRPVMPAHVSRGERSILALCYYFTEIMHGLAPKDFMKVPVFLAIDDPVSSFDLDNRIGVLSLLNLKLQELVSGNADNRILLMSHDLLSVVDFCKSFDALCSKDTKNKSKPIYVHMILDSLALKDLPCGKFSELKNLFDLIFTFAKEPAPESVPLDSRLPLGNAARRIAEAISTFDYHGGLDVLFAKGCLSPQFKPEERAWFKSFAYRLVLNGGSHEAGPISFMIDDANLLPYVSPIELQKTIRGLIYFLFKLKPDQINGYIGNNNRVQVAQTILGWGASLFSPVS